MSFDGSRPLSKGTGREGTDVRSARQARQEAAHRGGRSPPTRRGLRRGTRPDPPTDRPRRRRAGPRRTPATARPRNPSGVGRHVPSVETEAKPIVTRNQALGWLRQMMLIRRFEERAEMMYQKAEDRRLLPPVQRPGAGGRRLDRRAPRGRLRHHRLPRPRPRPGPRDGRQARRWPSCSARRPAARRARAARCTSSTPRRGSSAATRSSAATSRWPPGSPSPASIAGTTASASATSATAPSTRGRSTRPSTWPASGSCRSSTSSRTTSTPWGPRSPGRRPSAT